MKTTLYIKLILIVSLQCVVLGNSYFAQGDDPCTATSLTVNTTCSYANYNYASTATASTGIPAPGCANYPTGGDDVWFSAVVPASGILIVDMNTTNTGPSDMGMAFYSASSCAGPFTLIECDDDDSNNGTMPYINRPGLTPGTTVYIRVWEYGADTYGTFKICASTSTSSSCIGSNNASCSVADPFCTGTSYNYCNTTGVASLGQYNCLYSTPNPMWMYLNIQTSGNIDILIEQFTTSGSPIDVDFALWGPFSGISAACAAISPSTTIPSTYPSGNLTDCSYSSSATETANIVGATAGQWYMLLITNFNGTAGYIEFSQSGGGGSTNCNIVNPTCLITGVTATPTTCNASNQYSVSGAVSFTNPPASGTMTVTSSCGGTQTFNAPFTSPLNYNLTGITPTGGSCTVTASFSALSCSQTQTYTSPAIPTVNAGVDQTVCATTAVTLSGSGATTYSWTGGVTNASSFTPASTATYTLTGTNAQGCTATDQVQVTVNALPTTNAGADVPICAGASTTLTASGATTYTWSPSTGLSGTSGTSVTANPAATVTYTVTGTTGTCTATDQVIVTVTPLPTINAGTDQTICTGSSANLTASGGTTYSWSPATSLSATSGASVTSSATSTITYTVTGTTSGCTNTDQVIVNVNSLATANANVDQSVCAGGTITLSGSVGGDATTGSWSASSGSFGNSTSLTSTYTPSITSGTITLTLTSNDPTGPCPAATDQMIVTVNPSPTPNAGPDVSYCIGGSTTLTASGGVNYSWSPATALSATTGATVTANPSSSTTYTVTATSSSGCTASDAVIVTVNTPPTVNAGADQTLCQGPNVTLAATGASTYSWTGGISNGVSFTPSVGSTTYTVTGTDVNGCTNTDAVVVTINALPVVVANDVSVCTSNTVSVTASGANTYSWSPATSLSSATGSSVTFTPGGTTTYTVTGTSTAGCTSTDQVTVTVLANAPINAGADVSICIGASTTLTATGGTTYSWNSGLGYGNGFSVSPVSTTTYTVIGTDAAGCQGTDAVTVTVNPLPVVNAGVDQTVCSGTSVTLSGSGATTYSWDQSVTNGTSFVPASTQTYTVTGTSLGCTATDLVTVNVNPLPVITANDVSVCPSGTVTVLASGANTYTWSPATSLSATTGSSVTFTPGSTLTYTVTGTSTVGCTSTDLVTVSVLSSAPINAGTDVTLCAGGSTTLTATGGATYTWNNGLGTGNGFSVTPALTTTYTVTGTDVSGCTGTDAITVNVNPIPAVNAGLDQSICAGASVTLSGSGATTYTWDQGVTNGTSFVPASTQTYTVTGTSLGCTATDLVTVNVNPLPVITANDVSVCPSGTVTVLASGANTYTWSPATSLSATTGSSVTFTPGSTLTYTVTGTSTVGCTSTDLVTVSVLSSAPINAGTDVTLCAGGSTTLTATGGATYTWNNGLGTGNGFSVTPALTTTYTVTGTDVSGCAGTDAITVNVNPIPAVNAGLDQSICAGASVTLSGSGATTYTWDQGVTNGTSFVPASTQTYTVTGTSLGCTATDQLIVTVNALPLTNAGGDQTVCAGTAVTLNGSGANTYSWSGGVSDGVAFTPTSTATYTLTGTTAFGCTATDQVIVTVNPLPILNAGTDQSVCSGTSVTLSGSGASTYSWNNGVSNGVAFTPGIGSQTYTLTGTSAAGCTSTDQVVVTVNPNPSPVIQGPSTYCTGNFAVLSTSMSYTTYAWSNGATTATINATTANNPITVTVTNSFGCPAISGSFTVSENTVITANFTETICQGGSVVIHGVSQSTAGVYSQTFTSATGCDSVANVTLVVNPLPAVNAGLDQAFCDGLSTSLTASGASTYSWNNGITNGESFTPVVGSVTYTVTGTSVDGCTATDQVAVTVNALPVISAGSDQSVCQGAAATLSGTGGTSYSWNNGISNGVAFTPSVTTSYTVTGTDANGCTGTDQVQVTVNNLPVVIAGSDQAVCSGIQVTLAGSGASTYTWDNSVTNAVAFTPVSTQTYTVTGTDANSCTGTDQVVVTVNSIPTVGAGTDQSVCPGTTVTLSGSGATTYSWDNGVSNGVGFVPVIGTTVYTVTGTSAAGCSATDQVSIVVFPNAVINAGTDLSVCLGVSATLNASGGVAYVWDNGLGSGNGFSVSPAVNTNYTVTGTDVNGCTGTDQILVSTNALPVLSAGTDQAVCSGIQVTLAGSGASTYTWDNSVTNAVAFTPVSTQTYTVTGTDANGCTGTDQVVVTVNSIPTVGAGTDQSVCPGTTVTLSGSGATTYSWDNGVSNGVGFVPVIGTTVYTVTGTSAAGCSATDQVSIVVFPNAVINAGTDLSVCLGVSATLNASGGVAYVWDNGLGSGNGFSVSPAVNTNYTVTGTDVNGCTGTDQILVSTNALPVLSAGTDQAVCSGIQVTLAGSGASTYTWDNSVTNAVAFTPVSTQTYTVTGTDANGCTGTDQVVVTVNSIPTVGAGADQSVCPGTTVTLSGGGATTYSWNNGVSNGVGFVPVVGTVIYTVTGTTVAGCTSTDLVTVVVNPSPVVVAGVDQAVCFGEQVTLNGSGASIYTWTNSVTDGILFTPSSTTTYTVTGTDVNGCTSTDQVIVTVNPLPVVSAGNDLSICENSGMTLTGSGATSYSWDNGVQNGVTFNPPVGTTTYTVTGTTAANCTGTDQVNITVNALPTVTFVADTTEGCLPLQVALTNNSSNSSECVWTLSDGTVLLGCGSVSHWFTTSGCFDVTLSVTDNNGCVNSSTSNDLICVEAPPVASFEPSANEVTTYDTEIFFDNTTYGASTYEWIFGDPEGSNFSTEENPSHTYPNMGGEYNVLLTAYSPLGCSDTAWATIIVKEDLIFYVPNTFTPDNDGYNEEFKPIFTAGFNPFEYDFFIFNRWGQIVFESHNSEVGWNGSYGSNHEIKNVQDGTYTWLIRYRLTEGNGYRKVTGHVNVIR